MRFCTLCPPLRLDSEAKCEPSDENLQIQHTPNPAAQLPWAAPPLAEHSDDVKQVLTTCSGWNINILSNQTRCCMLNWLMCRPCLGTERCWRDWTPWEIWWRCSQEYHCNPKINLCRQLLLQGNTYQPMDRLQDTQWYEYCRYTCVRRRQHGDTCLMSGDASLFI